MRRIAGILMLLAIMLSPVSCSPNDEVKEEKKEEKVWLEAYCYNGRLAIVYRSEDGEISMPYAIKFGLGYGERIRLKCWDEAGFIGVERKALKRK